MKYRKSILILLVAVIFIAGFFLIRHFYVSEQLGASKSQDISEAEVNQLLNTIPLSFQKNEGQVDEQVEFLVRNGSTSIFFTPKEVVYSIVHQSNQERLSPRERAEKAKEGKDGVEPDQVQVIRQSFSGANQAPLIEGLEEQEGKVNYLIGNDPDKWVQNAPTFSEIVYKDLYEGIDLYYSGKSSALKYEYHVEPGKDYKQIQIDIDGATGLSLHPNGDLVIETELGNLGIKAPEVYQQVGGERIDIPAEYILISDTTYGFEISEYNPGVELIIDPYIVFSSYLGGNDNDDAVGIDIDGDGDVYVTGQTQSTNWPATSGYYQETSGGNTDVFVIKVNPTASSVVYSTYIGGPSTDLPYDIDVHTDETAYIIGVANTGYPFTGGVFNTSFNTSFSEDFITRLSADGTSLVWSSETNVNPRSIVVDGSGNAYMVGTSLFDPVFHTVGTDGDCDASSDPSCNDADDGNTADDTVSSSDVTILGIGSDGTTKLFAASYGGNNTDGGYGITRDGSGNLYIVGRTLSPNFVADDPLNGFQTSVSGGQDGFIIRTNSSGVMTYGSLIGGGGFNDYAWDVAVDTSNANYVAIAGYAQNPGAGDAFPTKNVITGSFPYVYDATTINGGYDGFVAMVNTGATGASSLIWSSLLGGDEDDYMFGVDVDSSGNVYVIGSGENATTEEYPVTSNAATSTPAGSVGESDIVVSKISNDGSTLLYSSFHRNVGGSGNDIGRALVVDSATSTIYGAGRANSAGMATNGVIQPTFRGGAYDGLVFAMTTTNTAPQVPTLVSPLDGGTATSTSVQIALNLVDLDVGDTVSADVRVSSGSVANCLAGVNLVASGTTNAVASGQNVTFLASGLSNGSTYTVCFRAYDGTLYSNSGSFSSGGASGFTVDVPTLLEYSTYLGGTGGDSAIGIDVDVSGDIYLFGSTASANFPSTGGVYQPAITASGENGFVARISPDGSGAADLVFSTFIGGTDCVTEVWGGKVDSSGNSYFTGFTCDTDYPVASGFQAATTDQGGDAFFTKMTSTGTALFYSTYIGSDGDFGLGYTVELFGTYVYVVGETYDLSFPTTPGAYDTVSDGNGEAFLTVLNHNVAGASSLEYSTFLGSPTTYDYIADVAIDGSGNAYLVGGTRAADFPTTAGAYDETYNGGSYDIFVAVIDPSGNGSSDLLYSAFMGGSNQDRPGGIAIDNSNRVHISGRSNSTDYPTTAGSYQTSHSSGYEWVLSKLNPAGSGASDLLYSTYISATGSNDEAYDIEVSSTGDIFAVGRASDVTASNFPTTGGAFDSTFETNSNGVIVQVSPDGGGASDLVFSSFIGGSGTTAANAIAIDSSTNIYIAGSTSSAGYQTTTGSYDETTNGSSDAFAMKLNFGSFSPSPTAPISTYLGGSLNDSTLGVGLDTSGNIIVSGVVRSSDFPTASPIQGSLSGTADGYIIKLNSTATTALVSTYFGGTADDYPNTSRVDSSGNVYVVGATNSTDLFTGARTPTTTGFDTSANGDFDVFLLKMNEALDTVLWGSYFGGSALDTMDWKALRVDNNDIAYIAGATQSTNFPITVNAFDSTGSVNRDSFIIKVDTSLSGSSSLIYSSYIGGSNSEEYSWAVNYDSSGNIYVGGETYSTDFPATTVGAFDVTLDSANGDGFLVKVDPTGTTSTSLVYGTYIGGTANYEGVYDIVPGISGNQIYACGSTYGNDLATTVNGYQQVEGGGGDMWVYKMDLSGNGSADLLYGSYLGGAGEEWCNEMTLDSQFALTMTGDGAAGFPTTSGSYQETAGGGFDTVVIRFNPVGGGASDLVYASYFGGSGNEFGAGTHLNTSNNRLYFTGFTVSSDLPLSAGSYEPANNGGEDGFVAALDLPDIPSFSAPSQPTNIFIADTNAQSGDSTPSGISNSSPVFSAICNDPDTGDIMNAYRVQVDNASSSFSSVIWDSGKQSMTDCIDGNRSQDITYGGASLAQNGATYFIRIKFWDDSDTEGAYSASGDSFTMASASGGSNPGKIDAINNANPIKPEINVVIEAEVQKPFATITLTTIVEKNDIKDVMLDLPIPSPLRYLPGTIKVNGQTQTDRIDLDSLAFSSNQIIASWPILSKGESIVITFQVENNPNLIGDFIQNTPNASVTFIASLNATDIAQPVSTSLDFIPASIVQDLIQEDVVEPDQEEQQEQQEDLPIEEQEEAPGDNQPPSTQPEPEEQEVNQIDRIVDQIINDEVRENQGDTGSSNPRFRTQSQNDGRSFTIELVEDTTDDTQLTISGLATTEQDRIEFTGTTSEPNTTITLFFNGLVTVITTSDDEGFWQTFISAENLDIQPGMSQSVRIEAIASKGDLVTERVSVGSVVVSLPSETNEVIGEFETVVTESDLVTSIQALVQQLDLLIEEREETIQQTLSVSAPVLLAASAPLWGYLPYLPTLIYHLLTYLIGLLGRRQQGKKRGVVYDTITKEPLALAIIRVYKKQDEKEVLSATTVTGTSGNYHFLLEPGDYRLEVKKPEYLFPSKIETSSAQFEISENTSTLPAIGLDPVNAKQRFTLANVFKKLWLTFQAAGRVLVLPALFVGALAGAVTLIAVPASIENWILAVLYIFLFLLQLQLRPTVEKAWGVVYDLATSAPLPLTTIQLISPEYGKVVKSRLTDYQGRFAFAPEPGAYRVKAEKPGYEQAEVVESGDKEHEPISGEVQVKKEGEKIQGDIAMRKK